MTPAPDELPDVTLTRDRRDQLKTLVDYVVRYVPGPLNRHDLMYISCAFEDRAQRMKGSVN